MALLSEKAVLAGLKKFQNSQSDLLIVEIEISPKFEIRLLYVDRLLGTFSAEQARALARNLEQAAKMAPQPDQGKVADALNEESSS